MDENELNDQLDEVIRDLPRIFNVPPQPPLDEMWKVVENAHFNTARKLPTTGGRGSSTPWLAAAAALLVGFGIGHYMPIKKTPVSRDSLPAVASNSPENVSDISAVADAYRDQTSRYLGQAAALLISLPA